MSDLQANAVNGPRAVVEQSIVRHLTSQVRQAWLWDFDNAIQVWTSMSGAGRERYVTQANRLLGANAAISLPEWVSSEVAPIQILNVGARGGRNHFDFLAFLESSEPLTNEERIALSNSNAKWEGSRGAWMEAFGGVLAYPEWAFMSGVWAALTPPVRAMASRLESECGPAPRSLDHADGYAWLARCGRLRPPADRVLLEALGVLSPTDEESLATILLDQHSAWRAKGMLPKRGCRQSVDFFVPRELASLACFSAPLSATTVARVRKEGIGYPPGIFRVAEQQTDTEEQGHPSSFFAMGVVLEAKADRAERTPAVLAGHAELLKVGSSSEPLLVLLDIDLSRPEVSFLGLKGSRLRICDWASHTDHLCITRVGLNGHVEFFDNAAVAPGLDKGFGGPFPPLVDGRPLVSPYEGMRAAGWLGSKERVGGAPGWEQEPEYPESPVDGKLMAFLAQFDHPNGGKAYAFLDTRNLIATVVTQWD